MHSPTEMASEAKTVGTGIMGGKLSLDKTGKKLQAAQRILAAKSKHLRKIFSLSILISNDVLSYSGHIQFKAPFWTFYILTPVFTEHLHVWTVGKIKGLELRRRGVKISSIICHANLQVN